MGEVTNFFDLTILPKLDSTKEYFKETLNQLEGRFTEKEPFAES